MVRFVVIALFALNLMGESVYTTVAKIIGYSQYNRNRVVIHTLFSHPQRYMRHGRIDLKKVVTRLEHVGLLARSFPSRKRQQLLFSTQQKPYLFLKLSEMAILKGGVFLYSIDEISRGKMVKVRYRFTNNKEPSLAQMVNFFQSSGVKIVRLNKINGGWHFVLSMESARLPAQNPIGELQPTSNGIWVRVCDKKKIVLKNKRVWYPSIGLYDKSLTPLDLIQKREGTRVFTFTLPNDTCYIKISDIFTSKNIKKGLDITAY